MLKSNVINYDLEVDQRGGGMKKHWTELTKECSHEVAKLRLAFLLEHQKADQIVCNNNGVPYQAIYFTPEMPDYGKTYDEVPMLRPPIKNVGDV
jgi:hypothetical protein